MPRYVVDTNLYIAADRNQARADELAAFYERWLPFTMFHGVVAQELLLGAIDVKREKMIRDAYVRPFESRGRLVTPTFANWARSGEVVARMVRSKVLSPGGFTRSFLNDVLLAVSCRAAGITLVTDNVADFERIRRAEPFDFVAPWPS